MRGSHRRPILRPTTLALCAAAAVGAWTRRARGEEPAGQLAGAAPTVPPYIEARPGEALPD